MRHPDNSYEFEKLNAQFDRKFDRLKHDYDRRAQNIFRADSIGTSARRRNPLWAWFDRKTKFRVFPKIMLALTALTFGAIVFYIETPSFRHLFGDYSSSECTGLFILIFGLIAEACYCIVVFFPGHGNQEFPIYLDVVTNPAFKDLECNVYHEKPDDSR
jgi:hypothetical protein